MERDDGWSAWLERGRDGAQRKAFATHPGVVLAEVHRARGSG